VSVILFQKVTVKSCHCVVENPGSKLKTAVTGKVKAGSADAKRRKSFCARSAGQMADFPKAASDPNSRLRQARKRWKC